MNSVNLNGQEIKVKEGKLIIVEKNISLIGEIKGLETVANVKELYSIEFL